MGCIKYTNKTKNAKLFAYSEEINIQLALLIRKCLTVGRKLLTNFRTDSP